MVTNLNVNENPENSHKDLEAEIGNYRLALEEAYRAIRWYVTVLGLAILTHNDELIINNDLIHVLEKRFDGKELVFDTLDVDGNEKMKKIVIKYHNEEDVNAVATISQKQGT